MKKIILPQTSHLKKLLIGFKNFTEITKSTEEHTTNIQHSNTESQARILQRDNQINKNKDTSEHKENRSVISTKGRSRVVDLGRKAGIDELNDYVGAIKAANKPIQDYEDRILTLKDGIEVINLKITLGHKAKVENSHATRSEHGAGSKESN
jgi:hypothetical protein